MRRPMKSSGKEKAKFWEINLKKVLITGSGGFTGTHLIDYLHKNDQLNLVGIDLVPASNIRLCKIDLLNQEQTNSTLKIENPDYIIHLAGVNKSDNFKEFYRLNLFTTINILEGIVQNKLYHVKSLFISSSAVYGKASSDLVSENSDLNPINFYGSSKLSMEAVVRQYAKNYNLKTSIVRPFNLVGPGQDAAFVIPNFIQQLLKIKYGLIDPEINTQNLTSARDFLDVRDAVKAYWTILDQKSVGDIYNIASGTAIKIRTILKNIIDMIDIQSTVTINEQKSLPGEIPVLKGDISRLLKLGWQKKITLERSIFDIITSIERQYEN
jgi:GDP-4-dehydro-6-deoxy-D-mannose reductase